MEYFERLVLLHIRNTIPPDLDPHQFAYQANRSIEEAIDTALQNALTHLEKPNCNVRLLLIVGFSSAFTTIIPHKLVNKLETMDFLSHRPQ